MAEAQGQSKTQAPTQRRLEEAIVEGRVAFSTEFAMAVLLLVGILVLWLGARPMAAGLIGAVRDGFTGLGAGDFGPAQVQELLCNSLCQCGRLLGAFLGTAVVLGLGVGFVQAGFHFSPAALGPRWEKLDPVSGLTRMFSGQAWFRGLVFTLKAMLAFAIAYWFMRRRTAQLALLPGGTLAHSAARGWELAIELALIVTAVFVVLGLADYLFQRWRHMSELMMSRQEVKEEQKRDEGDPLLKARIRRLQREIGRKRMIQDVPRATVVITNPTHLAVALRYERGVMKAPRVVAKGAGHVAQRIIDVARRHAVPVLERKPIARALFKSVKVGQEIPAALYYAVAEVLAYIYRLRNAV